MVHSFTTLLNSIPFLVYKIQTVLDISFPIYYCDCNLIDWPASSSLAINNLLFSLDVTGFARGNKVFMAGIILLLLITYGNEQEILSFQ